MNFNKTDFALKLMLNSSTTQVVQHLLISVSLQKILLKSKVFDFEIEQALGNQISSLFENFPIYSILMKNLICTVFELRD